MASVVVSTIYQTEQGCGDGRNEWEYCTYAWDIMKHCLENGANGYMYWNISLEGGGSSHWGWKQNSLVSVDVETQTYRNALAFVNPDQSVTVVLRNESSPERAVSVTAGAQRIRISMEADSFNTVLLSSGA